MSLLTQAGWTVLMHAAANGHLDVCKALVLSGVAVDATSAIGWDAAMYADAAGHMAVASFLRSLCDNKVPPFRIYIHFSSLIFNYVVN